MKTGRPTLYEPDEHPKAVRALAENGKTLSDIAEAFDVAVSTITLWAREHPEFSAALQLGREAADDRVERALFERATGYRHPAVKILAVASGQGCGSRIETVPYTEHYPPDVEAAKFWLKNRRPAKWREKSEVEQNVKHYVVELPPPVADNDPLTWAREVRAERVRSGELTAEQAHLPPPSLPQSDG